MKELNGPELPRGRLHVASINYVAVDWHVDFVQRSLTVTIELKPGQTLDFGHDTFNLSLHVPDHVVAGRHMKLCCPVDELSDNLNALRFAGAQLYLEHA
jgi:hypothetical protein